MTETGPLHIIVGGGIGGLTAALALLRAGRNVRVYEQAPVLAEVGAGLTLAKGAMQCLAGLGVAERVRAKMSLSSGFPFLHYQTGRMLAGTPPLPDSELKLPDPGMGGHIFRADFHRILADAVREYGAHRIVLDHALVAVEQDDRQVVARFANGAQAAGEVLVGADGVRSAVRMALFGEGTPEFTGKMAYRFLVPAEVAMPLLGIGGRSCLFVGHGQVFNRYLVSDGRLLNCVGLLRSGDWTRDGWNVAATVEELLAAYAGWHPDVIRLMERAPAQGLIKWGIFARPPRDTWVLGRVALLGDAAHPMQPFLGLGAAMAVEDGAILGRAFAEKPGHAAAFAAYQRARVPRANMVMELSRRQGELFDETDPADYPPRDAPAHDPALSAFDYAEIAL